MNVQRVPTVGWGCERITQQKNNNQERAFIGKYYAASNMCFYNDFDQIVFYSYAVVVYVSM